MKHYISNYNHNISVDIHGIEIFIFSKKIVHKIICTNNNWSTWLHSNLIAVIIYANICSYHFSMTQWVKIYSQYFGFRLVFGHNCSSWCIFVSLAANYNFQSSLFVSLKILQLNNNSKICQRCKSRIIYNGYKLMYTQRWSVAQ